MRPAAPLPSALGDVFTVAQARALGVSPGRLRGGDLVTPFRNVRARGAMAEALRLSGAPPTSLRHDQQCALVLARARAYALRMAPNEHFSHGTAALIWGLPLPQLRDHRVHVTLAPGSPRRRMREVALHAPPLTPASLVLHDGLRVSTPSTTWTSLGRLLDLHDLVAIGDAVVRVDRLPWPIAHRATRPALATLDDLRAATAAFRGHGRRRLEAALPLLRTDSWSRPESLLRLHLIEAGVPEPELNVDIFDADGWLACVDGAWPRHRVYFEYHGADHFSGRAQMVRDIDRRARLAAAGWIEVTLTAEHVLAHPREAVRRVRQALQQRGWRG